MSLEVIGCEPDFSVAVSAHSTYVVKAASARSHTSLLAPTTPARPISSSMTDSGTTIFQFFSRAHKEEIDAPIAWGCPCWSRSASELSWPSCAFRVRCGSDQSCEALIFSLRRTRVAYRSSPENKQVSIVRMDVLIERPPAGCFWRHMGHMRPGCSRQPIMQAMQPE